MSFIIETMQTMHMRAVTDIFNYYVQHSTAAYRQKMVEEDFSLRYLDTDDYFVSYVLHNEENRIIGFCTLEPFSQNPTFTGVAEVTYFIHPDYTGQGAGTLALSHLEKEAKKQGIRMLIADISTENEKSVLFHKKHGFQEYGRLPDVGQKFGRFFGIVYLYKNI